MNFNILTSLRINAVKAFFHDIQCTVASVLEFSGGIRAFLKQLFKTFGYIFKISVKRVEIKFKFDRFHRGRDHKLLFKLFGAFNSLGFCGVYFRKLLLDFGNRFFTVDFGSLIGRIKLLFVLVLQLLFYSL